MRGYMITPLLFVVLFLIASSFGFYIHQADEATSNAITKEGQLKKAISSTQKELSAMGTIAYETMYNNPSINKKTDMEQKIKAAISSDVSVTLSKRDKSTNIKFTFGDYVKQYGSVKVNLSGESYETVVGYPFYSFYEIYQNYNAQEVCNHYEETATSCTINWVDYQNAKKTETGFLFWGYDTTVDDCYSRKFKFKMKISEPDNVATYQIAGKDYRFSLQNKATGSYELTADC